MRSVLVGIFVGGQGTRMGGVAKGLLRHEGETLLERWLRLCTACEVPAVLVGSHPAYRELGVPTLDDADTPGPLGGLRALLCHAKAEHVVAVACDMPYVTAALLERLLDAPPHPVVAARRQQWEPFFARYQTAVVRALADGLVGSMQPLFAHAAALSLSADEAEQLRDWDTLADRPVTEG